MSVVITGAQVEMPDGTVAARIERVVIGGGTRTRTIDGEPVDSVDPQFTRYHVRLLSQAGPMIPDELAEAGTYEEACEAGEAYAAKVAEHAGRISELRQALR